MHPASEFPPFAHRLADAARPIAQRYFRAQAAIEMKGDNSPVTAADREIEATLRQMIEHTFPAHGIIGEEGGNWNESAEWVWVIDPIDGTRAFIAGRHSFTTLVALCHKGSPVLGIIDQPIKGQRWVGCDGQPTTYNGEPCQPSGCTDIAQAQLSTTSSTYFSASEAIAFGALEKQCAGLLLNHDAYAFGMLAKGDLDVVIEAKLKPYDFCALAPVVTGAGGHISDWRGNLLNAHSDGNVVASASKTLHEEILAKLS